MDPLWMVALITGLTTGGLSCMLVQGGLLTTSLASQLEAELRTRKPARSGQGTRGSAAGRNLLQPILLFLGAKLFAYTVLGFALGALGSVLSLTPGMRGALQIAIGIFMVGNALRMLQVHPVFRYFNLEPPARVTRALRRKSKQATGLTPLVLGAMTVLIPCGVTQSMMALAMGTGSPLLGAGILFAFTLGASPVFFGLTYLAMRLGALLEKNFTRVAAAGLILLGLWTLDGGLNLVGSPVSLSRLPRMVAEAVSPETGLQSFSASRDGGISPFARQDAAPVSDKITIEVGDNGYTPDRVRAPANQPVQLQLVTRGTYSCSRAFLIPSLDLSALLPARGVETLDIPPQKPGTRLQFTCSMGMFTGVITFQ
ncbi:MAG TPA: hypothetical protein DEQ80_03865 [Anaerolinea thermolimosa]|uniref:Sulfite exporter TauE/SafE family protein n=1 Tax=Anaerolinea thermolimosa TaxID=229919 RepID=A0A3D1JH80_9CHLR|nr:hypothetical protein [Anaerolinea thermolimosa]